MNLLRDLVKMQAAIQELSGSSVNGIFQARILEQVAISYSRGSFQPGIEPASLASPALAGRFVAHR